MTEKQGVVKTDLPLREEAHEVNGLSMVVFSGDFDKILAAFIIANGAAAMDLPVSMFFTFWGLNVLRKEGPVNLTGTKSFMEKMFGWMMPKGPGKLTLSRMNMGGLGTVLMKKEMAKKNVYDLPRLIKSAQEQGVVSSPAPCPWMLWVSGRKNLLKVLAMEV